MPKILITGSQGLLGCSLVPYLRSKREYEVIQHGRDGEADTNFDCVDAEQVRVALDKVMPEVIINLVALTDVDECERKPEAAYLANVRVVENFVRWIRAGNESCHLIQISTDHVYDGPGPHKEDAILLSNYYAFSKYAGELVAASVSSTVVRTNFLGASRCPDRLTMSDWLIESLTQGTEITVFNDIRFSPLTLERLVCFLELVVQKRCKGTFNLGSKEGMSKADFAFALAETLKLPTGPMRRGHSEMMQLTAYRPKDMVMDSSSFESEFGVQLPTLKEEIESMREVSNLEAG